MANICCFDMHVSGKKQNIRTLFDWMRTSYDYGAQNGPQVYITQEDGTKVPSDRHLGYRIYDCDISDKYEMDKAKDDDELVIAFSGSCAWSCVNCMLVEKLKPEHKVISLPDACKALTLEVELFSEETGERFSEHISVHADGSWTKERASLVEFWLDEYDSYEELKEDLPDDGPNFFKSDYDAARKEGCDTVILCEYFAWQDPYDWPWSF